MIDNLLSLLRSAGPPIANHFWQSTAFVAAIGLLVLLFGENRARVRYRLWLAASLKFLIPFSALIALGSVIPRSNHAVPVLQSPMISAVQAVAQPFSAGAATHELNAQSFLQRAKVWLPVVPVLIWALGFAAVFLAWYARWRHVSKILERAIPVDNGREIEILRRIENNTKARTLTRFLISSDLLEPGIFGIFHPVLLWPAHLSDRLEDAHLEAILVHEVAHVHRRDNLTALIHMVVEAIFWFHPFVWWIERRMLEERERACDEAVVQLGGQADIYADSLLRVSRFCAELPLPCVSGITGADLSKRIRCIMASRFTDLGIGKRLTLAALALGVVAGPVAFGLMQEAPPTNQILHATGPLPSFEVASIKPAHSGSGFSAIGVPGIRAPKDRFIATNITIKSLILWAWSPGNSRPLPEDQVTGGPSWINSDRYDIDAKLEDSQIAALEKLSPWDRSVQVKLMVQSLLGDRFKLVLNDDTTVPRPVYALVIAKGGPKLQETARCSTPPPGTFPMPPPPPPPPGASPGAPQGAATPPRAGGTQFRPGEMMACAVPISDLTRELQLELGRPVLDQTGLKGNYNFDLKWTPEVNSPGAMQGPSPGAEAAPPDASGPSIFTAVQEQLGLKLESTKSSEEAITIAHVEKPSAN
jgi:bla regulator protein blaR1